MPKQLKLSERLSALIENCGAATEDDLRWLLLQQPRNKRLTGEVARLLSLRRPIPIRELLTVMLEDDADALQDEVKSLREEIRSMEDTIGKIERRLGRNEEPEEGKA